MSILKICQRIIEYSFYAIFLLVPLAFTSKTSELFEFNKMWLTFGLTIIIAASWFTKMILQRRILIQRTPLDIPILLFLASQVISTIFSLDTHVSIWGYYSRFNGGLLSIITYVFLYYAFLSNFPINKQGEARQAPELESATMAKRLLSLSLISGLIVTLWGLPSHFGYDPTCLLFRGNFDVSCWTADFQPKVRIFSTLGQPNWLAAYLAILIPISLAYAFINSKRPILNTLYLILYTLFLLAFLYTRSQSGFFGLVAGLSIFLVLTLKHAKQFNNLPAGKAGLTIKQFFVPILLFLITLFFAGPPIEKLKVFSYQSLINKFTNKQTTELAPRGPALEYNITSSGNIRSIVWKGALEIFKHHPLIGTGVETFAFAYYKYKLPSHNLTSEWNFLYNKAHNEYLNFLATTGAFGLITYLTMIGSFLFIGIKRISKSEFLISKQIPNSKSQLDELEIRSIRNLALALLAGYIATLIIHFFGFSVVITNLYLFMIPAFVFVLLGMIKKANTFALPPKVLSISGMQWTGASFIILVALYLLRTLSSSWNADKSYAYGYNLDRAGNYQEAYPYLQKAVQKRGFEPVFKDEFSINNAELTTSLISQNEKAEEASSVAAQLAQNALTTSDDVISKHPNNVVFWKSRTRVFYTLSQVDPRYLPKALEAIKSAYLIAPNDANISYNLGVLYGQNHDLKNAIATLEKTIGLKPDYKDAYYALGLFYHQNKQNQEAIASMQYILEKLVPNDPAALDALKSWGVK